MTRIKTLIVLLAVMVSTAQGAIAAEKKAAPATDKPQYRQVTGDVVSLNASAIVVKSKSKSDVSLMITNKTNMNDAKAMKAGDRARVHYKEDKNSKTATKIVKLTTQASAAPAAPKAVR
jgi:hypothetical protein